MSTEMDDHGYGEASSQVAVQSGPVPSDTESDADIGIDDDDEFIDDKEDEKDEYYWESLLSDHARTSTQGTPFITASVAEQSSQSFADLKSSLRKGAHSITHC